MYTAKVRADATGGYVFPENVRASVNGKPAVADLYLDGSVGISFTFDETDVNPVNIAVTGVALDKTAAQSIDVGGTVSFTATVSPADATDGSVKWSVGGTNANAVKLYSDANCTQALGTEAGSTLTVYARGVSAGSATVTVTSNADSTKSASCAVTVNAADASYPLWVGNTQVNSSIAADTAAHPGWSYAADTNTLSLSGITIETVYKNTGIYYEGDTPLKIELSSANILNKTNYLYYGIQCVGDGGVEISGAGSLMLNASSQGIKTKKDTADIVINGGTSIVTSRI